MTSRIANCKAAAAAGVSTSITPTSSSSRQRWQPEEDALVQEYVRRHGPREWHLLRSRMGVSASRFVRDPKSCAERWKNYLGPGLKKGPLSAEEQALALALQARHGNRWKLIAKSLPGRTPKRLGKWWEVFSDRQRKQQQDKPSGDQQQQGQKGLYDHILDTYVEKHALLPSASAPGEKNSISLEDGLSLMSGTTTTPGAADSAAAVPREPVLSLGTLGSSGAAVEPSTSTTTVYGQHVRHAGSYMNTYYGCTNIPPTAAAAAAHPQLPAWLSTAAGGGAAVIPTPPSTITTTPSSSQSVGLSLTSAPTSVGTNNNISISMRSPPHPIPDLSSHAPAPTTHQILLQPQQLAALESLWRDLEDSRQGWVHHRKEAAWRLGRLEQQLEAERARRSKDRVEECEARVRALREEQAAAVERIEMEYRDQLAAIQRDAESREGRLLEGWAARHARLARVLERVGSAGAAAGAGGPAASAGGMRVQQFSPQFPYNGSNNH